MSVLLELINCGVDSKVQAERPSEPSSLRIRSQVSRIRSQARMDR